MEQTYERRQRPDSRRIAPRALLGLISHRRRRQLRRQADRAQFHYIDYFEPSVVALCIGILVGSLADALLTLQILERGGVELNPLMARLITWHTHGFVLVKYAITAVCVLVLIAHVQLQLAGRVSVKHILAAVQVTYLGLISYELVLLFG